MTHDDDAARLAELARELPALDLDATSAARIAERARQDVGRGRSLSRLAWPVLSAVFATSYLAWAISQVLDGLR
jgi:hypothetical protein